jgi:hypothetical protein
VSGKLVDLETRQAVLSHIEAALAHLNLDEEIDRLVSPRHTDHDRHVYLPRRVAEEFAKAREEIQAAIDELTRELG